MDDELTINLKIGNRLYPIKINRKDEEDFRKAGALINDMILLYKKNYPLSEEMSISERDYLACVTTHIALKYIRLCKNIGDMGDILSDTDDLLGEEK